MEKPWARFGSRLILSRSRGGTTVHTNRGMRPPAKRVAYTPCRVVVHVGDPVHRRAAAEGDEKHERRLDHRVGNAEVYHAVLPVLFRRSRGGWVGGWGVAWWGYFDLKSENTLKAKSLNLTAPVSVSQPPSCRRFTWSKEPCLSFSRTLTNAAIIVVSLRREMKKGAAKVKFRLPAQQRSQVGG